MGDLYAAQTGGVGFRSSPGEGAASCESAMELYIVFFETALEKETACGGNIEH